jgi:hypothetical protein
MFTMAFALSFFAGRPAYCRVDEAHRGPARRQAGFLKFLAWRLDWRWRPVWVSNSRQMMSAVTTACFNTGRQGTQSLIFVAAHLR